MTLADVGECGPASSLGLIDGWSFLAGGQSSGEEGGAINEGSSS